MRCLACSLLIFCACGGRPTGTKSDGSPPGDSIRLDKAPLPVDSIPNNDQSPKLDGLPGACGGPPTIMIGGEWISVGELKTGIDIAASCCGPGETLRFLGRDEAGQAVTITFQMVRFPQTPATTFIDFSKPPDGWFFSIWCEPSERCGNPYIREENSTFSGTIELAPAGALLQERLTLCLYTHPKPTAKPGLKALWLAATDVVVNLACAPGMDQMCNEDPMVSSYKGKCNDDSSCTCNPGATKAPSGRCL